MGGRWGNKNYRNSPLLTLLASLSADTTPPSPFDLQCQRWGITNRTGCWSGVGIWGRRKSYYCRIRCMGTGWYCELLLKIHEVPSRESVTARERAGLGFAARSSIFPTSLPDSLLRLHLTLACSLLSALSPSRLTLEMQPDHRSLNRRTDCRDGGQSCNLPASHESGVSCEPLRSWICSGCAG